MVEARPCCRAVTFLTSHVTTGPTKPSVAVFNLSSVRPASSADLYLYFDKKLSM